MTRISPVTQIAMRKNMLFKQTLVEQKKKAPHINNRNLLLGSLAALAVFAASTVLSNCSKVTLEGNTSIELSETDTKLNSYIKALGLLTLGENINEIQNIGFTDDNNYRHIITPQEKSKENSKFQHLKINPEGLLVEVSNFIVSSENNYINIDSYKHNGDFLGSKKYELLENKIIEYTDSNGVFVPNSELYKTENGFEQKFINGDIKEFKDIKNNEKTPNISVIFDESLEIIEHEIVL